MDLKDVISVTQSLGFPILLVIWFILRTEKIIERNTIALQDLVRVEGREIELLRSMTGKDVSEEKKI